MKNNPIYPFKTFTLHSIEPEEFTGSSGKALWHTLQLTGLRIREVEYSPGYFADHWCKKGHIVYCLKGSFMNELDSGELTEITAGMGYIVSDAQSSHRSFTINGAVLLIIDGSFLAGNDLV